MSALLLTFRALSLTAHWVDTVSPSTFSLQRAVLKANKCHGSHTSALTAKNIKEMVIKWNIPELNVHVGLSNITKNMKKATNNIYCIYTSKNPTVSVSYDTQSPSLGIGIDTGETGIRTSLVCFTMSRKTNK